uniref:Tyrosinase copper-binding domain-containing protein n=1 Tax=Ciona savignyi TaxID=51511 RepID=H2YIR0_CIOSA
SGIGLNNAFNGFDTNHREKAETFISELERVEEETDDLDAVLDYADARQRSREVNDIMYRYVIEAYMVHSKLCKKNHVRYPDPPKMDPSVMQSAAMTGSGVGVGVPEELWMNYWRCDADFNFHHNHWHAVYRGSWDLYYRQGELFGYMHAQMLARYDADRESWGLDPVKEYKFDETEPDGFDAGFEFHNKYGWMVPRPKEQIWPQKYAKENQENEKKIWKCFDEGLSGSFILTHCLHSTSRLPMDTNIAGHIIESSSRNFSRNLGSFHNMGHMRGRDITTYMGSPLCAVRDPIFFRWHKHVDNLYQYWNNKVKTDLKENAPPVIIDPCDVIMVPGREMPKDFEKWGGNDWMKTDFSNGEIQTTLKKAELAFEWDYKLGHEEFTYFLRLKRKPGTEGELRLTLRLFICKEEHMNNRRRWIEMDKFVHIMPAKMKQCVVKRLDRESSVIKRSHDATNKSDEAKQPSIEIKQGNCDCGWPYSMLLPRGDKNGEKWLLGVYVSDANNDEINVCASCGSMSYCGTEDQVYPDKMIMGYPFATPMAINNKVVSISDAASQLDNFCITPFTIRNDHPFVKPAPVIPPIPVEEEEDTPLPLYSPLNVLGEFGSSGYSRLTGRLRVLLDDTDFHQMGVERVRVVFKGRSDQAYNITNVRIALRMGNTLNIDPKCNVDVKFKGANEAEVPMEGLMSDELVVKTGGENDYWLTFTLGSPGCFGLAENHNRTNTYRL